MNARLQVEHPVTEARARGRSRCDCSLRSPQALPLPSEAKRRRGSAAGRSRRALTPRIPPRRILPATGTISRWEAPSGPGIRVGAGVREGSEVSHLYLAAGEADRLGPGPAKPVERLTGALEAFRIDGVPTNLPLQLRIARDVTFRAGYTTTAFLVEHENFLTLDPTGDPDEVFLLAIGAVLRDERAWRIGGVGIPIAARRPVGTVAGHGDARGRADSWRLSGDLAGDLVLRIFRRANRRSRRRGALCRRASVGPDGVEVSYDGERYALAFPAPPQLGSRAGERRRTAASRRPCPERSSASPFARRPSGRTRPFDRSGGDEDGTSHRASRSGVVKAVAVAPGALVTGGATLVEFE